MFSFIKYHDVFPLLMLMVCVVIGFVFEMMINQSKKISQDPRYKPYLILLHGLKGMPFMWCVGGGIYSILLYLNFNQRVFNALEKLLLIGFICSLVFVLANILVAFMNAYIQKALGSLSSPSILSNIVRLTIYVLGALVVLQSVGISITPIITALGVGGLAVALALQDTLANLFAGFYTLVARQIRPTHYVKLESGEEGFVTDINWRTTTIRELKDNIIIIPNTKLATAIVKNYSLPTSELAMQIYVGISYHADLEHVQQVTIDVGTAIMKESEGGVASHVPVVRFVSFDASSINMLVVLRVRQYDEQAQVKHDFIKALHKRFQQEGISIPYPITTVQLEQNQLTKKDE